MLAHQLAAVHQAIMDHLAFSPSRHDIAGQAKRLNAVARCMSAYQQGLLTLRKLRQGGHQRISVQCVNVTDGSQAVIGNVTPPSIDVNRHRIDEGNVAGADARSCR